MHHIEGISAPRQYLLERLFTCNQFEHGIIRYATWLSVMISVLCFLVEYDVSRAKVFYLFMFSVMEVLPRDLGLENSKTCHGCPD